MFFPQTDRWTAGERNAVLVARRIIVVGPPGAGKSTLGRILHIKTGLPFYRLDDLYWRANWERPDGAAWIKLVERLSASESWIIDGNNGHTLPLRLKNSDLVIHLNLNAELCLARVIWRDAKRFFGSRSDLPAGILPTDKITQGIRFWRFTWRFARDITPTFTAYFSEFRVPIVELRSRKAVKQFIACFNHWKP